MPTHLGCRSEIIWAERLTFLDCFFLFFKCLLSRTRQRVHYDKHTITRSGAIFLSVLKKIKTCQDFFQDVILMLQEDGAPNPHQIRDRVDNVIDKFLAAQLTSLHGWKRQMTRSYIASAVLGKVEFTALVEAKKGVEGFRHKFFLERDPINSVIIPFLENQGYPVQESISISRHLILISQILRDFYRSLLGLVTTRRDNFTIGARPAAWIEYTDLILPLNRYYLFWYGHVDTTNFDVVCYFDRPDTIPNFQRTSALEKEGLKWVNCADPIQLAHFRLADIYALIISFFTIKEGHNWWLRFLWIRYQIYFQAYRLVFRHYRVKMVVQHQEGLWSQMPQAKAIEEEGGIMVGFHWSNYPLPNLQTHLKPQHVFFVWGKAMSETLFVNGHSCNWILPCGVWMLPQDEALPGINQILDDCDFILGIFDSSVARNAYQTPEALGLFYTAILELLEKNPNWGGFVKSKKSGLENLKVMLPLGDKIVERLNNLIQGKRLAFLDWTTSPTSVAMKVDLSVCFGFNTVGVIAGALGRKAIHWDCAGHLNHPIYSDKRQKVLYLSLEEFKNAIIFSSKGDMTIGDFSSWRKDFNYFDDLLAPQRVGKFITNYMEKVVTTSNAKHSLDFSANLFIEENSVKKEFFEFSGWWPHSSQYDNGKEVNKE